MTNYRCAALSVVKHDYVPHGVASHPRFELAVVADDASVPDWAHERNQIFADEYNIPYVQNVEQAIAEYDVQVAVVSSEAERHCDLSVRAANSGLHIVQDKPMSTKISECDRVVEAVERNGVKFLMWNRNFLPGVIHARDAIEAGQIGWPYAIHVDFYFAKDAGVPKGTRGPDDPPLSWLKHQIASHVDGSDGGVGHEPMGELKIEGIYPLAYIRMLTGADVERVFARTAAHFHQVHADNDVEDLATVSLEMERGMVGSLCIGRIGAASHPDHGEIKIQILGTEGSLVISEARPEVCMYFRNQGKTDYPNQRVAVDNDYLQMEGFARAIETGGDTVLDARAGRAICATVQAAIDSGRTDQPVATADY